MKLKKGLIYTVINGKHKGKSGKVHLSLDSITRIELDNGKMITVNTNNLKPFLSDVFSI